MTPVHFPQVTSFFGAPPGLSSAQVMTVPAFVGAIEQGSMEGSTIVVTAWKPSPEELKLMVEGAPVFLTFLGGLPPHMASVEFAAAVRPA